MKEKPVSKYVTPGGALTDAEEVDSLREAQQRAEDIARIEAIKAANRNKVAEFLNQDIIIYDYTFPFLWHTEYNRQVSVMEYYPEIKVALDRFYHFDEWELALTKFKKEKCNANGVKYVYLTPDKDLADLLAELEVQSVK